MGLISGIVDVMKSVLRIGKVVVPVLRGLRDLVPEIGKLFDGIDGAVESGEVAADDFFDRNLGVIGDTKIFFAELQDFGEAGEDLCDEIITASQVETPDEITVQEGRDILLKANTLRLKLEHLLQGSPELERRLTDIC